MKAAIVYESSFGNTRRLAEAMGEALAHHGADVTVCSVDERLPRVDDLDLLVIGAPTHVHGLSSARSRQSAVEHGAEEPGPGIGVRGFFEKHPPLLGVRAAAFDTRYDRPVFVVGSAARGIAKRLERAGAELVAPPESFFVDAKSSTLLFGELGRASTWAKQLAEISAPALV